MDLNRNDTAVVFIDPQNDVLSEKGLAWGAVGNSVKENKTIENMERIFKTAKDNGFEVYLSPLFLPHGLWMEIQRTLGDRRNRDQDVCGRGPLSLDNYAGSGADRLERFKPYIEDGKTITVSPHKVWGPQTNDLVLQLRKRRISKVILGGMLTNICVESHLRELLEQGFEVCVVKDATAGPRHPEWGDGYQAALINFSFLAHAVLSTDEVVKAMGRFESKNKALVLEAFDTLFNQRDYVAAERFWSPNYIQHSAHIAPGREGLFNLVKGIPPTLRYEPGVIVAEGDFVIVHGRFSGFGQPVNWIVANILRIKDGILIEHWDVIQNEATQEQSKSGNPMFGDKFPVYA